MARTKFPMIALSGLAIGALAAGAASAQSVSIGTLPQGSLAYGITSSVAKVISDNSDLITRAVGIGGSNIYIPQVNNGKLEMSTANAVEANFALNGTGTFPGKAHPNLRILTRLLTFQVGFMVRKESDIQAITDFKGRRFPSGFTSQKIVETLVRAAFATEGMSFKDVKGVPVPNFIRATDQLVSGKVEGSFLAPGSGVVRKANAKVKIRFLSLAQSPENAKTISRIAPGAFYTVVKPVKRMPYVEKPTTMLGFDYLIIAGTHVSNSVAYKAVKALYANKKGLIAGHGVLRGFSPKLMGKKGIGVDYHPGAVKFYKEAGVW